MLLDTTSKALLSSWLMNFYRFFYAGGSTITFLCPPHEALPLAAAFAKWMKRELIRIREIRPARIQLALT